MLNNLLTAFNMINTGANAVSGVVSGLEGLFAEGQTNTEGLLPQDFVELLAENIDNPEELQKLGINLNINAEGENANSAQLANINLENKVDLEESTLKTIEQILSNTPIVKGSKEKISNLEDSANIAEDVLGDISKGNQNIIANVANITEEGVKNQGIKEQTVAEKIASVNTLTEKNDPRLWGQDNLQGRANSVEDKADQKIIDVASNTRNSVNQSNTLDAGLSDKGLDIKQDIVANNNNASKPLLGIESFDASLKTSDSSVKLNDSNNLHTQTRYLSASNGEVKIAQISKSGDIIEVKLDPASFGKIEIKFDFTENTNKVNVLVLADKQDTLDILRNDSRAIEKILQESGIKSEENSLNFSLKGGNGGGAEQQNGENLNQGKNIAFNVDQLIEGESDLVNPIDYLRSFSGYQNNEIVHKGALDITV